MNALSQQLRLSKTDNEDAIARLAVAESALVEAKNRSGSLQDQLKKKNQEMLDRDFNKDETVRQQV